MNARPIKPLPQRWQLPTPPDSSPEVEQRARRRMPMELDEEADSLSPIRKPTGLKSKYKPRSDVVMDDAIALFGILTTKSVVPNDPYVDPGNNPFLAWAGSSAAGSSKRKRVEGDEDEEDVRGPRVRQKFANVDYSTQIVGVCRGEHVTLVTQRLEFSRELDEWVLPRRGERLLGDMLVSSKSLKPQPAPSEAKVDEDLDGPSQRKKRQLSNGRARKVQAKSERASLRPPTSHRAIVYHPHLSGMRPLPARVFQQYA